MSKQPKPLRLVALEAENFKRLVAVSIKPDGSLIEITGKNGQGKSSVLDAIWAAVGGAAAVDAMPIRKGADEALIKLDLGHLKIKRSFRRGKDGNTLPSLSVESVETGKFSSPQQALNRLFAHISFDPPAFMRMNPEEKFEELKKFVPDFDFVKNQGLIDSDYSKRTEVNRRAKTARAQAEGIKVPEKLPERVDIQALVADMEKASAHNSAIERERIKREQEAREADAVGEDAERLQKRAVELRQQADDLEKQANAARTKAKQEHDRISALPALPAPIDVAALRQKIESGRAADATFAAVDRRNDLIGDAEIAEAEANELTASIEAREKARADAIASAKMPVKGLDFGNGMVLLNGVPFEQASTAEQLRAATAIAMRMNPELRIVLIKDGSLLDEDSMKILAEMAQENDFQVFVERVGTDTKVGFVIEDGRVKGQALEAAE